MKSRERKRKAFKMDGVNEVEQTEQMGQNTQAVTGSGGAEVIVGNQHPILYVYSVLLLRSKGEKTITLIANKINAGKAMDVVGVLKTISDNIEVECLPTTKTIKDKSNRDAYLSIVKCAIKYP
jgi:DNA-binding protein